MQYSNFECKGKNVSRLGFGLMRLPVLEDKTIDFDQESLLKGINATSANTGEDFYGDDGFNEDELDAEGFDIEGGSGDVSIDTIDDLY